MITSFLLKRLKFLVNEILFSFGSFDLFFILFHLHHHMVSSFSFLHKLISLNGSERSVFHFSYDMMLIVCHVTKQ